MSESTTRPEGVQYSGDSQTHYVVLKDAFEERGIRIPAGQTGRIGPAWHEPGMIQVRFDVCVILPEDSVTVRLLHGQADA